jgi:aminoglycoside 6'-N-acetyltransferase I
VLVAEATGGRLVGFVEVALRSIADGCADAPVGYLEGLYVLPDDRRRGVGTALVDAAEAWAREQGCAEMGSDALLANLESQAFHRARGYEEVDRQVTFRRRLDRSIPPAHVPGSG